MADWKAYEDYLVRTRYSVRDPKTGEPLETTYDAMLDGRILPALKAAMEASDLFPPSDVSGVIVALRNRHVIPATPALMSLGNQHTRRPGLFSCYPLGRVEDSLDGIDEMKARMRQVYTRGGGVGIDVSGLRAKGALVDCGQGTSSGPVAFLQDFDAVTGTTNQGGRRRGALLVQMDWNHPDIREFVAAKNFNGVMSRLVRTLPEAERPPQTGTLTNMNLSVNVFGDFWEDGELLDLIARNMWATGDPGLLFIDNMLAHSPIIADDEPKFSNPCGEALMSADLACNLVTVNVAKIARYAKDTSGPKDTLYKVFLKEVALAARRACLLGNAILGIDSGYPSKRIREKTQDMCPVGVGMSGFHSALLTICDGGYPYGSKQAQGFAVQTQAALTAGALNASMELAKASNDNTYFSWEYWTPHLKELQETLDAVPGLNKGLNTDELAGYVEKRGGFYNCVTTSQPPSGSVSAFLHNLDTGIEPFYAASQERKVRSPDGGWDRFELEADPDVKKYLEDSARHPAARDILALDQLEMLGAFQKHCHTGISKTVTLPASATVEDVKDLILKAKDLRLKGFTVYRDGSLDQVITVLPEKKEAPPASGDERMSEQTPAQADARAEALARWHARVLVPAPAPAYEPPRVLASGPGPAPVRACAHACAEAHPRMPVSALAPMPARAGGYAYAPMPAGALAPAHAQAQAQAQAPAWVSGNGYGYAPADIRAPALAPAPETERRAVIFKARGSSLNAHVTLAHDAENNIREVFVAAGEMGADVNAIYAAFGMILSVALRHDPALFDPLVKVLCKVNMDQRITVKTSMGPEPVVGSSLPQAIGLLMRKWKDRLDAAPAPAPKEKGAYDICPECGKLALRREGSCRKCFECGYSSC
jgi:ribonucleoside-diphosphate reductase alpha chain